MKIVLTILLIVSFSTVGFLQSGTKQKSQEMAAIVCGTLFGSLNEGGFTTGEKFERGILEELGYDANVADKEAIVSDFLNKNAHTLICTTNGDAESIRDREQVLKKAIGIQFNGIFEYMRANGNYKGKINFNIYEIIDGEIETLLDYLYKIYDDEELLEEYDEVEVYKLIKIVTSFGGKRGSEL